jgi:N-acetylglutamate synthase-like GNAT family acetyltransferase
MAAKAEIPSVIIRRARSSDAQQIAKLSDELGYPSTRVLVLKRLRTLRPAAQHTVFVAETKPGVVVGWLHISMCWLLESEARAEVNALVVSASQRSLGAGAQLLAAAEAWSKKQRCRTVNVRSNVIRDRAHKFYLRNGYEHYKTQKAFRKTL